MFIVLSKKINIVVFLTNFIFLAKRDNFMGVKSVLTFSKLMIEKIKLLVSNIPLFFWLGNKYKIFFC